MTLQDLENALLAEMQQPGVNFGGAPTWSALNNPAFNQGVVDYAINQAYKRVMRDLQNTEVYSYAITFNSTANTSQYPIPSSGGTSQPAIAMVQRVFYAPSGLGYTYEFEPGIRFLSWPEFQAFTGEGYLRPYSFGVQPDVCAVTPDRKNIAFYPGSANAGDTITVNYMPIPTPGAVAVATLVAETDAAVLPDDASDAMLFAALMRLWPKAREFGAVKVYKDLYDAEIAKLRDQYTRASAGFGMRLRDKSDVMGGTYPMGPMSF